MSLLDIVDEISDIVTSPEPVDPKKVIDYLIHYPNLCISTRLREILTEGKVILLQPYQMAHWPWSEFSRHWSHSHFSCVQLLSQVGFPTLPSGRPNPWRLTQSAKKNKVVRLPAIPFYDRAHSKFFERLRNRWQLDSFSDLTLFPFVLSHGGAGNIGDVLLEFECCRLRKRQVDSQSLDFLRGLTKLCSYAMVSSKRPILYLCDRPKTWKTISRDSEEDPERFHCTDGPAIEYRDGWKDYYLEGIRVPSWVVTNPELLTVESISNERNAEVRRVLREKYGEGQFLFDSGAKIIDVDTKDVSKVDFTESRAVPRMLVEVGKGVTREKFLVGTDGSTGRVYYMLVPLEVRTCEQAHNRLAGFDENIIVSQS